MDWYPRRPQSYRSDTWGLTLAEHGAYCLLLDYYYQSERPLPNNDAALAGILAVPVENWLEIKENVLKYFLASGQWLMHETCDEVIEKQLGRRRDGHKRSSKYRERLETVTRDERVCNAPRGEERRVDESKESNTVELEESNIQHFEAFWKEYPPRTGHSNPKKPAKIKFLNALRKKTDPEIIIHGAKNYALAVKANGTEPKFVAQAVTWLNQERWNDHQDAPAKKKHHIGPL